MSNQITKILIKISIIRMAHQEIAKVILNDSL